MNGMNKITVQLRVASVLISVTSPLSLSLIFLPFSPVSSGSFFFLALSFPSLSPHPFPLHLPSPSPSLSPSPHCLFLILFLSSLTFTLLPSLACPTFLPFSPSPPHCSFSLPPGVFEEEVNSEEMVGRTSNFHGCISKFGLMSGETSATMVRHSRLRSSAYRGVKELCRS